MTENEETIPVMYIGLNREELLEALSAYEDNPPLTELEQGFESIELNLSFHSVYSFQTLCR